MLLIDYPFRYFQVSNRGLHESIKMITRQGIKE